MHLRLLAAAGALAVSLSAAHGQETDDMQKSHKLERKVTHAISVQYLLFTPKGYDPTVSYTHLTLPTILRV